MNKQAHGRYAARIAPRTGTGMFSIAEMEIKEQHAQELMAQLKPLLRGAVIEQHLLASHHIPEDSFVIRLRNRPPKEVRNVLAEMLRVANIRDVATHSALGFSHTAAYAGQQAVERLAQAMENPESAAKMQEIWLRHFPLQSLQR